MMTILLGISDPLIYDVACNLAEMHMDDVGLQVSTYTTSNPIHHRR
jgi:hypothetical protein